MFVTRQILPRQASPALEQHKGTCGVLGRGSGARIVGGTTAYKREKELCLDGNICTEIELAVLYRNCLVDDLGPRIPIK